MWYVFPQLRGLGRSETAQRFAITSHGEAVAYAKHPLLGRRLRSCVTALQDLTSSNPVDVFGEVDSVKLRSSLTLFEAVTGEALFGAALERWFAGSRDDATLRLLARSSG
jgi:uncharacterized protein (DUF1810 family)